MAVGMGMIRIRIRIRIRIVGVVQTTIFLQSSELMFFSNMSLAICILPSLVLNLSFSHLTLT